MYFAFTINSFKLIFLVIYAVIYCLNGLINFITCILKTLITKRSLRNQETIIQNRPQPQKKRINIRCKKILEAWYQNNITHPYASKFELNELLLLTGIEERKIKRWLDNRRLKDTTKPRKLFTDDDNALLKNFFENFLSLLSYLVQKDCKKIQAWFARKRFIKKKLRTSVNKFIKAVKLDFTIIFNILFQFGILEQYIRESLFLEKRKEGRKKFKKLLNITIH